MASRTIVALLITAAVLGIVVAPIPHSSADSTPIASGNYWIYQYDDIESGVRARGSIMMQMDNSIDGVFMGQSATMQVVSIAGNGTISGSYQGHQVTGNSTILGSQVRLASNFSLVSDNVVTMTNETVIGVGGPVSISMGYTASYGPVQNDYIGDDDHGVGCVIRSTFHVSGTAWSDDGTSNDTHTAESDATMTLRVVENGVSVTTPAGTFLCQKVNATMMSGNESESLMLYYSDQVGNYVKMEGGDFYFGSMFGGLVLKAYSYTMDSTKPTAMAGEDRTVRIGRDITLDARGSTDNIGIVNYTWSFVAGSEAGTLHRLYGQVVHVTFEEARKYKVMLSVTDGSGNVAYDEIVVTAVKRSGMNAFLGDNSVLLAVGVVMILVAVLVLDGLVRKKRRNSSLPAVRQEPPSPKE